MRILVVDDSVDTAIGLQLLLSEVGFEVDVAHDGESAMMHAQSFEPDVVLLDIGLPMVDGYELAGRLLAHTPAGRAPRLIAVSGHDPDEAPERSTRAGIERHLLKPVVFGELLQALREPAQAPGASPAA
jgi:CheY-like chemotaxis protein